jgi:hypothetical protein
METVHMSQFGQAVDGQFFFQVFLHVFQDRLEAALDFSQGFRKQARFFKLADMVMTDQLNGQLFGQIGGQPLAGGTGFAQFGDQTDQNRLNFGMEQALFTEEQGRCLAENLAGQILQIFGLEKDREKAPSWMPRPTPLWVCGRMMII